MNPFKKSDHHLPALFATSVVLMLFTASCGLFDNGEEQIPEITHVRYIHPDTAAERQLEAVGPGDVFVIVGKHLEAVKEVYFNGVAAGFNPVYVTSTHMVITVPDINFQELDPDSEEMNTIRLVSDDSEFVFEFPVTPPPASISRLNREFGEPGHTVRIFGEALFLIIDVYFPGDVSAAEVTMADDGSWVDAEVPGGADEGGLITIETVNETLVSPLSSPFNDWTGMICDFDEVNNFAWGAHVGDDPTLFTDAIGSYAYMQTSEINPNNRVWWEDTRSVNISAMEWVDPEHFDDPPHEWALKFDIYIKEPLQYGTFMIRPADEWDYIARYEPWEDHDGPYSTDGWITVTIPLTEFRTETAEGNGTGESAGSIRDLNIPDQDMGIMFVNDDQGEDAVVDELLVGFDNIRVVRIAG